MIVAVCLTPLIFKKEIQQLKFVSVLLFIAITIFMICFTLQLIELGTDYNSDADMSQYFNFKFDRQFFTAVAVFITAYSFQFNLFPVLSSLKTKTYNNGIKAVVLALGISMVIYMALSILSIYTFGSALKPNLLDNVGHVSTWESISLRIAFGIVIISHIPFIFFAGKGAFLDMIDEWDRRSTSQTLDEKLLSVSTNNLVIV